MHWPCTALLTLAAGLRAALAQGYPPPPSLPETNILNRDSYLTPYLGKNFLKANIPFIDIPDRTIQGVYYYRWYSLGHHLIYTAEGVGYHITEFIDTPSYAKAFGTIDAAAGHQIQEASWLRSPWFATDYAQIYTRGPGDSRQYTHWIHDATEALANTTGNQLFLQTQLDGFVRMWNLWNNTFDSNVGLYYFDTDFDAQEYSLPGYVAVNALNGANPNNVLREGPLTYRPSLNGYMFANARVIANVARAVGNTATAQQFAQTASNLEQAFYKNLWNASQAFFVDNIRAGEPGAGQVLGREEVGFFPYRFGLGLQSKYVTGPNSSLFDSNSFNTPYGPPTLEVQNKNYTQRKPDGYCCYWQGQSWPFSTSHTIKSLAAWYRAGLLTADQYYYWLRKFANTQQKDGAPYVAESHYPVDNAWSQDDVPHSSFYQHSTNNDLVITGLLGVIPRSDNVFQIDPIIPSNWTWFALENLPYHGNLITVLYDKDGSHYNRSSGLTIYVNNVTVYNGASPKAQITLPTSTPTPTQATPTLVNIAANPYVAQTFVSYPQINATYTWSNDSPLQAIDGVVWYDENPHNRWSNYGTTRANDTLTLTFARPRNVSMAALAVFVDVGLQPSGAVDCPQSILISDNKGNTLANVTNFPSICNKNDLNIVNFTKTFETQVVNFQFTQQTKLSVGIAELQLWVPGNAGPLYLAADAVGPGGAAQIAFDRASTATSTGAVFALGPANSNGPSDVQFAGVFSANGGSARVQLRYKNTGAAVSVQVTVNQNPLATVTLNPSASYTTISVGSYNFLRGSNYVDIIGGATGVFVESITLA